ncbi:MAG: hypothetical protein ACRDT6_09575 [Micromonosporaceae bacterium]
MKITQYMRQEKAINAADVKGIRERWLWGLRLLRDPDAIAPDERGRGGSQLRKGVTNRLIQVAKAHGFKLSEREIQRRLQAARTYKTDSQIASALTQFDTWSELLNAGFPDMESEANEPPADHRIDEERNQARARALLELIGEQGALFPLDRFEPMTTTLKDLEEYTEQQEELTARFAAHDRKRRDYLESLKAAARGDLNVTWQQAHEQLGGGDAMSKSKQDTPEPAPPPEPPPAESTPATREADHNTL